MSKVTIWGLVFAYVFIAPQMVVPQPPASGKGEPEKVVSKAPEKSAIAPQIMSYQGYLTNNAGIPLDGSTPARVSIWDLSVGGSELWAEELMLTIAQGYFTVELGLLNPIPSSLFNGSDRWLEIKLGQEVLAPRKRIVSVANAFYATNTSQIQGHFVGEFYLRSQADNHEVNEIDASKLGGVPYAEFQTTAQADDRYVNKDEPNAIHSQMIADGAIQPQDLGFAMGTGDITAVDVGTGLTGGSTAGEVTLSLSSEYATGEAYDRRFVKKEERNSVSGIMIADETISSSDILNGSIQRSDLAFSIGDVTGINAGPGLTGGGSGNDVALQLDTEHLSGSAYDERFVNENQMSSVTGMMIADGQITSTDIKNGSIQQVDLAFPAGDITAINATNGISGGGNSGDLNIYLEPNYQNGAAFDSRFVNEGQPNSVTSAMIANGTIQEQDLGFPVGDLTAVNAGTGLTGGGASGDVVLSLATPFANGSAFDGTFVNEGQANSVFSSMILDGQVSENDIAPASITGNHLKTPLSLEKTNSSGSLISVTNRATTSNSSGVSVKGYNGLMATGTNNGVYAEGLVGVMGKGSQYGVWAESQNGWSLWVQGRATCTNGDWGDLAEYIRSNEFLEGGDVVVADARSELSVRKCWKAYDSAVVGVVSTKPTITVGHLVEANEGYPLALAGIVPCKVTDSNGAIEPGDMLTTSEIEGHAMKATDPQIGTIIGKALERFASGSGKIRVLVTLR